MIVKINRQYVVDGYMSELHECDKFTFIDPNLSIKAKAEVGLESKRFVYRGIMCKGGDIITEIEFVAGDSIYVMENGQTIDKFYIPSPPQGECSPK